MKPGSPAVSNTLSTAVLCLVELQPNYGCEILALCENVKVEAVAGSDQKST